MYEKILNFIKYNNTFTIILAFCFLSFGVTFAASPAARDAVYSSSEVVVSVDNTAIVSSDLDNFNFNLKINSITEDDKNYYADYSYETLAITDSVWQRTAVEKTLTVSKESLDGKDFGLYAAKELADNMNYELSYLKRVQKLEKDKGESPKVVTTQYSGLIGKLLNPKEEVIEGYNPVIPEVAATADTASEQDSSQVQETKPQDNPAEVQNPPQIQTQFEPTPTPTPISEPATSTPVIVSEPTADATSTPATSTPLTIPEATTTPEVISESAVSSSTSDTVHASSTDSSSTTGETLQ